MEGNTADGKMYWLLSDRGSLAVWEGLDGPLLMVGADCLTTVRVDW